MVCPTCCGVRWRRTDPSTFAILVDMFLKPHVENCGMLVLLAKARVKQKAESRVPCGLAFTTFRLCSRTARPAPRRTGEPAVGKPSMRVDAQGLPPDCATSTETRVSERAANSSAHEFAARQQRGPRTGTVCIPTLAPPVSVPVLSRSRAASPAMTRPSVATPQRRCRPVTRVATTEPPRLD